MQPGARAAGVTGWRGEGQEAALRVAVREKPEGSRANRAVVELLAELLGVPRGDVSIVAGESSRDKWVEVRGLDPETLRARVDRALAGGA